MNTPRVLLAHSAAVLLMLAELLLQPGGLAPAVAAATATLAGALLLCALFSARCAAPLPAARVRTALRDRRRRTAFLPQRDPDAAGRPRPRAPGRPLRTAA
ncbi:hypothetical protein GCM10009716_27620 [Streptomyces sodiiphilus]|uniref:Histidine kinase n=1 Tax=Streptomyces sodiiphilus TaxID=226217 RepID=A0ABN2PE20_9ACTN